MTPRRTLFALVSAAAIISLQATVLPPATAALGAPGGLTVANKNSSTPILSWGKVKKAMGYQVQVDNDSSFGSPEFSATTVNYRAVPTAALRPGQNFWRVRATQGSTTSTWTAASMTVSPVGVPVPTAPADGAQLAQPQSAPLLRWNGSQGATSYAVEVDGDADFIGAKVYNTKTTSVVIPDPLTAGDYYWRVTAVKAAGIVSVPSSASRFDILALAIPTLVYPPNSFDFAMEDVVFDWAPVAGAKAYDLQVALDQGFNNVALDVKNTQGTRFSPPTTLNSDQFWWRVRAVDLAGQPTPWSVSNFSFRRNWPDKPQAVFPGGTIASPSAQTTTTPYYQWTPVQHATYYQLYVDDNPTFSSPKLCTTAAVTYVPRNNADCGFGATGTTYWRVRPMDLPYSGGLPGIFSEIQAFTWTGWAPDGVNPTPGSYPTVTGLKISVNGQGLDNGNNCSAVLCDKVPTSPVLSWDAMPGMTYYKIYYAQDENFTTTEIPNIPSTENTRFALRLSDSLEALPESAAANAYYWYVQPCDASGCGLPPVSQDPPLPGAKTFRKVSPAVSGLTSSDPSLSEITLSWNDYYDSNQASEYPGIGGERSWQTARTYHIQVDTDTAFTAPFIDDRTVDQATYTAFDRLYPEGTLYWRVQALDSESNGLTWSSVQSFTKSTPAVQLTGPGNGSAVAGTTPFTWNAQAFASSYTIEVYRNNDAAFSPGNRVFAATVKTTAYAWNQPLPADSTPYIWRVRKTDSDGNVGPWSAPSRFTSLGSVPQLLAPGSGYQPTAGPLFEWSEVPGAATYFLEVRVLGATGNYTTATTSATAYAPVKAIATGDYTWRVTARDAGGNSLGTSATRAFKVDATPPSIKKVKPESNKLKAKSLVTVVFTEKVLGVGKKSLYITPEGKKKAMKAKVKLNSKGTKAVIDVKPRFKPGTTYIVHATTKIKDVAGNVLAGGEKPVIRP